MDVRRRRIISSIAGTLAAIGLAVLQGRTGTVAAEEKKKAAATGTPTGDNASINFAKMEPPDPAE